MVEHIFIDDKGAPPTKGRAIARVIIVSVMLCVPIGIAVNEYVKASQMEGYQHASGTIVNSDLTDANEYSDRAVPYSVIFQAQFAYGGRTRIGTTSQFGTLTSDAAEADAMRRQHPVGSTVDVWFEPHKLPEIVIDRPSTSGPAISIGIIATLWLFMVWIYFIPQLKRAWNPDLPKPSRLKVGLRLFFLMGFLVPTVAICVLFLKPAWATVLARSWPETPARIISVNTIENRGKLTTWKTDVLYSYEVDGLQFFSNQYNPTECSVPYEAPRRQAISMYSPGQVVRCFVDPRDPARSTLTRHISPSIGIGVWPVMFVVGFGVGTFAPDLEKLDHIHLRTKRAIVVVGVIVFTLVAGTCIAVFAVP